MKKLSFILAFIVLTLFTAGCLRVNRSGDHSFLNVNFQAKNSSLNQASGLGIYYIYPNQVSKEGKEQITIFGQGFQNGAKVFLEQPEFISFEAFVFNPGYLQAWPPAYHPGTFRIGVVNPGGEIALSPMLFTYTDSETNTNSQ